MKAASLNVDDVVELSVEDYAITIVPVKTKEYSLDALMAGVTNENIHEGNLFPDLNVVKNFIIGGVC